MKLIVEAALALGIATGCSGVTGDGGGVSSSTAATSAPAVGPTAAAVPVLRLPPQGVYNSCEIDTALTSLCKQEDAAIVSDGYKWEINYIGLLANKTGTQSLQAWFTYDASIGLGQAISVKAAINDPSNVLYGRTLITSYNNSLANSCRATNNWQIISCVYSVARSVRGFNWKWYIYDEPGCPTQSIGYCQGTLAGHNYLNVQTLAKYIHTIDPYHEIIGTQVGDDGGQAVINNLYSWLTTPPTTTIGFDRYPIPSGNQFGSIEDIGLIAKQIATTITTHNPSANMFFVGQAFSWYQERGNGCSSITVCPYPTTAQLQQMRDQALYYAYRAGKPLSLIFWYYWPDITCMNSYPGCNAPVNRARLKYAAFAPFPTVAPR